MSSRIGLVMLGGNSMKEITKVVVDAMGGDNAPHEIIKGAVEAVGKSDAIHVILVRKRRCHQSGTFRVHI